MHIAKTEVAAMLRNAWIKAANDSQPLILTFALKVEAYKLRFMLYGVLKGVKKSPDIDRPLYDAWNACVLTITEDKTEGVWVIKIAKQVSSPFMQSVAGQLQHQGVRVVAGQSLEAARAEESLIRVTERIREQEAREQEQGLVKAKNPYYTR